MNWYATKKTMAQGLFDVALLTTNANQIKFVINQEKLGKFEPYKFTITMLALSILIQVFFLNDLLN